jgi:malonyl-ACP decarboxylase
LLCNSEVGITGLGVTSAVGQGKSAFIAALMQGKQSFDVMRRPGRQRDTAFLGAEISSLSYPDCLPARTIRSNSLPGQVAMATVHEAWHDSALDELDPSRIGLIIGGSNFQQREIVAMHEAYANRSKFLSPRYAMSFLDTDLCGLLTAEFGIRGFAYTIGAASASGQVAILQAVQAVKSGQVDACLAVGVLMDLSHWELQAFRSMGAMGSDRYQEKPALACRPFDKQRDGFIFGECCGAVVVEAISAASSRRRKVYGIVAGAATVMDANRNPDPSLEGEVQAISRALSDAQLTADEIDYVNPHGTGSLVGDEIELRALVKSGLSHAFLNTTKSITGHGLTAAGVIGVIATLLQMEVGQLHPSRNLEEPIDPNLRWVLTDPTQHKINAAITLCMGFGGINTAICLRRC